MRRRKGAPAKWQCSSDRSRRYDQSGAGSAARLRYNKRMYEYELGFGTEYEKFIMRDIARSLIHELGISSVCEYPSNRLMGDNSEVFEAHDVTVDRLTFADGTKKGEYDLVWNFCEIECAQDPLRLINQMLNLTRRYVLIVSQNKRNIGVPLHRIYHVLKRREWDHGIMAMMSPKPVCKLLKPYGNIVEVNYFDVPWFVLDVYETGGFLRRMVPRTFAGEMLSLKKSMFEEMPTSVKSWLAHHGYVLFEKGRDDN